jgi:nucleoside phosphorylase
MEGAAFMLVCKHFKKNFIQIRGISNIIGKTERKDWNFKEPIINYSNIISEFITKTNKL